MNEQYDKATAALEALYADWEANGGVSPDTYDESLAIAEALGRPAPFSRTDEALDMVYELAQSGATPRQIATMHVDMMEAAEEA